MSQKESNKQVINQDVIQAAEYLLQHHFATPCEVTSVTFLSEPERRNVVLRLSLGNKSDDIPANLILKQSLPEATDDNDKDAYVLNVNYLYRFATIIIAGSPQKN